MMPWVLRLQPWVLPHQKLPEVRPRGSQTIVGAQMLQGPPDTWEPSLSLQGFWEGSLALAQVISLSQGHGPGCVLGGRGREK